MSNFGSGSLSRTSFETYFINGYDSDDTVHNPFGVKLPTVVRTVVMNAVRCCISNVFPMYYYSLNKLIFSQFIKSIFFNDIINKLF